MLRLCGGQSMMGRHFTVLGILVAALSFGLAVRGAAEVLAPVNPNATPEARALFQYLQSIRGERMLAGHHVMYDEMHDRDLAHILEATGKVPALLEFEGGIFELKFDDAYADLKDKLVAEAIDHWKRGGIVAVCWHWGNPLEPENTYPNTKIKFDIQAAFQQGTPEHEAMMKDLDVMAGILRELQDAKVPVLWRPLHEICGGWFWWSKQGEESAEELWRFIYTYFTDHHELNNLLWVYSYSQRMKTDWNPGLETMDIVGVDIYRRGQQDEKKNHDRMAAVAAGKPVALSECDVIPDPDVMQERGFLWDWFTTWHSQYVRRNEPDFLKHVYTHDLVITRDELPDLKAAASQAGNP